jgi:hypothetical protein
MLNNIPDIPDGTALTTSRERYEEGISGLEGSLHFASYGDPVFEALMSHMTNFELPSSVRRLAVEDPDLGAATLAYAISTVGDSGLREVRLSERYSDLDTLQLVEDGVLDGTALQPLGRRLESIVKLQSDRRRGVRKIEELNDIVGLRQSPRPRRSSAPDQPGLFRGSFARPETALVCGYVPSAQLGPELNRRKTDHDCPRQHRRS